MESALLTYVAYKALFRQGMMEAGCMAHARRRFHELYANHQSQIVNAARNFLYGMRIIYRSAKSHPT